MTVSSQSADPRRAPTARQHVVLTAGMACLVFGLAACSGGSDDNATSTVGDAPTTAVAVDTSDQTATDIQDVTTSSQAPVESNPVVTETTVAGVGGNPSTEGSFEYVVEAGDFPVLLADKFGLDSWRDIIAVNGWASEADFPLPGTVILMPASEVGVDGENGDVTDGEGDINVASPCDLDVIKFQLDAEAVADGQAPVFGDLVGRDLDCLAGGATWLIDPTDPNSGETNEYLAVQPEGFWTLVTFSTSGVDLVCSESGAGYSPEVWTAITEWCESF